MQFDPVSNGKFSGPMRERESVENGTFPITSIGWLVGWVNVESKGHLSLENVLSVKESGGFRERGVR